MKDDFKSAGKTSLIAGASSLISFALVSSVLMSACSSSDKFTEPFRDAPRSQVADYGPMDVWGNADGFSNVGGKCDGYGNRIYVLYKGDNLYGAISTIGNADLAPQDPCKKDFHNVSGAGAPEEEIKP